MKKTRNNEPDGNKTFVSHSQENFETGIRVHSEKNWRTIVKEMKRLMEKG